MNAVELLERVRAARAGWDAEIADVPDEAWARPGLAGEWTLCDVVAHISWFEREMIQLLATRRFEGSELWLLPPHERNAAIYRENQGRPVTDVRAESSALRGDLLQQLATLGDSELGDASCFPPMPADWSPLDILSQNTFEHYEAHAAGLRRWLTAREGGGTS